MPIASPRQRAIVRDHGAVFGHGNPFRGIDVDPGRDVAGVYRATNSIGGDPYILEALGREPNPMVEPRAIDTDNRKDLFDIAGWRATKQVVNSPHIAPILGARRRAEIRAGFEPAPFSLRLSCRPKPVPPHRECFIVHRQIPENVIQLTRENTLKPLTRLVLVAMLAASAGCAMQAKIIKARHWDLNETIRETGNEQLLLNLVRLRHDETPYFLQISSITTNFSAGASVGASGTFPSSGDQQNVYGLNSGFSYSESPSVTWSIPDSREFLGRFYAPIGADQLTVLAQSGFDLVEVFRVGVQKMNLLRNREFRVREGEFQPASYADFVEALDLMEAMRREGVIDFAHSLMTNYGGVPLPISQLEPRGVAEGLPYGLMYLSRSEGMATPYQVSKPLYLRFSKTSDSDPRAARLRQLLKLRPDFYSYPITDTVNVSPEGFRAIDGKLALVYDPDVTLTHIGLTNRSVLDILRFAAASVEVPEELVTSGAVRRRNVALDEYLDVRVTSSEPANAWLKVPYRGSWYYIPQTDLNSRTTFTLLSALFASVVGDVPGAKPVLTLPVN